MKGETGVGFNCPPTPLEITPAREEGLLTVGEGAATVITTSLHLCDQKQRLVVEHRSLIFGGRGSLAGLEPNKL